MTHHARKLAPKKFVLFALLLLPVLPLLAAPPQGEPAGDYFVQGVVLDSAHHPLDHATVRLQNSVNAPSPEATTDSVGHFVFAHVAMGRYQLSAAKAMQRSVELPIELPSPAAARPLEIIIRGDSGAASTLAQQQMQFADQPNFSVAGVTDWTAVGGHGSDSTLRATESLASAAAALKSAGKPSAAGGDSLQASAADTLRMSGERLEKDGDPLAAVRDFEQAAKLEPSEQNYFAWGSELLLHRAIWQAGEVFRKAVAAFPDSVRIQTGLGTALFAGARYDDAASRLCAASALDPGNAEPYLFLGRMQIAAPNPLACVEPALARFVSQQPDNPTALYLYAMALLKRNEHAADKATLEKATSLLQRAVTRDPQCGDADLQLGILAAEQRHTKAAIAYYQKAIAATPDLADAHYRLGVAYDRSGQPEKAKQEFQRHDELKQQQAQLAEQQRRDVKQFLFEPGDGQTQK